MQEICCFWYTRASGAGFKEWEDRGIKLHDAMRKTVREYGVRVIAEKRLIFILADLREFDEFPSARQVIAAIVSNGAGKELCRLFLDDDHEGCISCAQSLVKSLSEEAISGAILLFTRWTPYSSRSGSQSLSRSLRSRL